MGRWVAKGRAGTVLAVSLLEGQAIIGALGLRELVDAYVAYGESSNRVAEHGEASIESQIVFGPGEATWSTSTREPGGRS